MRTEGQPASVNASFQERFISSSDGILLRCCHTSLCDNKPSLMIVLPFGVPAEVARAAFGTLEWKFNVITWESRYILNVDIPFSGLEMLSPAEYINDMLAILRAMNIKSCWLIGYCSGAGVSLLAAKERPDVFRELILVSGEYQLFRRGHVSTSYQRSIDSFLPVVASSRRDAQLIFSTMSDVTKASSAPPASELQKQVNAPFSTEERLFRYAKTYMSYRDFDALGIASNIRQTPFVVTGRLDEHSDMENSLAVRGRLPQSTLFIDDQGDHYSFCRSGSRTLEAIAEHVGV